MNQQMKRGKEASSGICGQKRRCAKLIRIDRVVKQPSRRGRRRRKQGEFGIDAGASCALFRPGSSLIIFFVAVAALACMSFPGQSRAAALQWNVQELPVATGLGDHLFPDLDGSDVFFLDRGATDSLFRKNIFGGVAEQLFSGAEIWAGPASDGGAFAWQDSSSQGCLRFTGQETGKCIAAPRASSMALSGQRAIISDSGSTIRLLDFSTMRSRMLDSYDTPNMRYDPDIDGAAAVWVKERGYAGQYYEPLIVSCNLETDDITYLTKLGGGAATGGGSKYLRRHPVISNDKVVYQQKLNQPGQQWDIYTTDPATYGVPLVQQPGDQVSPSLSGNLLVYQDNRNGFFDENGQWVDNWDIYLKDLSTNIEQPICIQPGDQTSPVIKGNTVVWQDKRNGKPDIYAATLTTPAGPGSLFRLTRFFGEVMRTTFPAGWTSVTC